MISTRRLFFIAAIAVTIGVLTAFAISTQAERDDSFEAIATAGLRRMVPTDELNKERNLMLARITPTVANELAAESGATEVEFIVPESRSYIAVVVRARKPEAARVAADLIATEIAVRDDEFHRISVAELTAPIDTERESLTSGVVVLQEQIDDLIAEEARAAVPLGDLLTAEEQADAEARVASVRDEIAELRTQRDLLVEQQNVLTNDAYRAALSVVEFKPALVIPASSVRDSAANALRSALVTAFLAAAAAVIGGLVVTAQVKNV